MEFTEEDPLWKTTIWHSHYMPGLHGHIIAIGNSSASCEY